MKAWREEQENQYGECETSDAKAWTRHHTPRTNIWIIRKNRKHCLLSTGIGNYAASRRRNADLHPGSVKWHFSSVKWHFSSVKWHFSGVTLTLVKQCSYLVEHRDAELLFFVKHISIESQSYSPLSCVAKPRTPCPPLIIFRQKVTVLCISASDIN